MAETLVCTDCGHSYVMTDQEKGRFEDLIKNVENFQMPKRCFECRRKRRMEKVPQRQASIPQPLPTPAPVPASAVISRPLQVLAPPPPPPVSAPPTAPALRTVVAEAMGVEKEEVRFILATKDFEDLVHGRPIIWQGVRVILADIGFKMMRDALDRAEMERAKTHFRKNGGTQGSGEIAS